jgi:CheY-like chemotaxis protein
MKKILIADDNEDVRVILNFALKRAGYEVIEAENGEEAYNLAHEEVPNLIILDMIMPKSSGIEATRRIRTDQKIKHIPIFISTCFEHAHKEFNKDPDSFVEAFIEKPYKIGNIVEKVKKALGEK